ncbi:hypothetical protein BTUL_0108g00290 [Botrytis tulipae]|uniref:Uncharacterized protein n=1 Tax=Botrytis tulipae TaxID=87230 RepID=A0A4Z1EQH6_9HELO|nr:hypothetical protein BTUL_0108g00290 [Botrytis tulipae]
MSYIPSPRILKPKHGVSRPEVRYRNDHVVINQAGSRAYQQKEESSHPKIMINGGKVCGHNGIVSTWSSPPYH